MGKLRYEIVVTPTRHYTGIEIGIHDSKRIRTIKSKTIYPPGKIASFLGYTWEDKVHKILKQYMSMCAQLEQDAVIDQENEILSEKKANEIINKIRTDVGKDD